MQVSNFVKPAIAIGAGVVVGGGAALAIESIVTPKAERLAHDHDAWKTQLAEFLREHPEPGGNSLQPTVHRPEDYAGFVGLGAFVVGTAGGLVAGLASNPVAKLVGMGVAAAGVAGLAGAIVGYNAIK